MTETPQQTTPAGWHPDPDGRPVQRYWDGEQWTDHVSGPTQASQPQNIVGVVAVVLAVVGVICSQQSVSVLSGMSTVWLGTALAVGAALLALLTSRVRLWIKVVTVVAALVCCGTAVYDYQQLEHKRQEIRNILNDIPSYTP